VPPADSDALAEAISLLLDRPDIRKKFGDAARQRVHNHYNADKMVDATLQVFEQVSRPENNVKTVF
jgi:glycosyltransferase involved in cell wall biosynthesis